MATKTKEVEIPFDAGTITTNQIIKQEKADGWRIIGSRSVLILKFAKEDPPSTQYLPKNPLR